LSLTPVIVIGIALFLLYLPVMRFKEKDVEAILLPNMVKLKMVIYLGVFLGGLLIMLMGPYLIKGLALGFGELYADSKTGDALFPGYVYTLHTLYAIIQIPLMIYWGYYISYVNKSRLFSLLLFVTAFVPSIIFGVGGASRGMLFFRFIDAFVIVLIFKKNINKKLISILSVVLMLFVVGLLFISISITQDRFGEGDIVFKIIAQYFGESFINANVHFFGNLNEPLLGERMFPDLYNFFSGNALQDFPSKFKAWDYYSSKIELYVHYFKTLPIDFYIEFGTIGAFLIVPILSLLGKKFVKSSKIITFFRLIWIVYYYQICFGSIFSFTKAGHDNFIIFIGLIMIYFFFSINFRRFTISKI